MIDKEDNRRAHGRNLRKGRVSRTGQVYAVTAVTINRQPVFRDFRAARILINILKSEEELGLSATLCFVVMPDHFHWLLQLGEKGDLASRVRAVKSLTSNRIGKPIWQKGFHDHALRREEDIKDVARYIVANPLRAGLVNKINDYPHWHAIWL